MVRRSSLVGLLYACTFLGCSVEQDSKEIILATTTSTQDSGLLDALLPAFERQSGIKVKVVAVGSGQALELGRRGDADVLLTHSPEAEKSFMEDGWGESRLAVMHNDFVVVGPMADEAGIKSAHTASDAFRIIAESGRVFVSRDDESGTHQREKSVWAEAGIDPEGTWYVRAGMGMAQALRLAHEKKAYTLCDRATYLSLRNEIELVVLVEGDDRLLNRYSVIAVSREKCPHIHADGANRLANFLVSPVGQKMIEEFGVERYGQALFVPDATAR